MIMAQCRWCIDFLKVLVVFSAFGLRTWSYSSILCICVVYGVWVVSYSIRVVYAFGKYMCIVYLGSLGGLW